MARPKSMTDFSNLIDPSYSLSYRERQRKKGSISLAAGLIMASEAQSPKNISLLPSQVNGTKERNGSDGLFYAYIQKSDYSYSQSLPYTVAFASASVATQWWELVKQQYPQSERPGPQLFILRGEHGEDVVAQIQENSRFHPLRNRWFFMTSNTSESTSVPIIPLQDYKGNPLATHSPSTTDSTSASPPPVTLPQTKEEPNPTLDPTALSSTLDTLTTQIATNTSQIHALATAQSEGLRRMQDIAETHSAQIKALADSQARLQAMLESNATHFLALSNSTFSAQEKTKSALQTSADQIRALADGQKKMAATCAGLMKTMDGLGGTVKRVGDEIVNVSKSWGAGLDAVAIGKGSGSGSGKPTGPVEKAREAAISVSPPPRKLNRRIKSIWYEYEDGAGAVAPKRKSNGAGVLEARPKTPNVLRS